MEAASPPKKGSQPRLAALGSPFQGKGLAWTLPPSYGRRCPEGAEVGWGWRDEKIGEDRLKCAVCESTLSTAGAVPLPQWGRLRYEDTAFLDTTPFQRGKAKRRRLRRKKEANPASLRSAAPSKGRGSRGRSLLPMEGGAPKGRIRIKCSAVLCKSIYESSIIKQMIWTGWGLVTSSGVTLLQNR